MSGSTLIVTQHGLIFVCHTRNVLLVQHELSKWIKCVDTHLSKLVWDQHHQLGNVLLLSLAIMILVFLDLKQHLMKVWIHLIGEEKGIAMNLLSHQVILKILRPFCEKKEKRGSWGIIGKDNSKRVW